MKELQPKTIQEVSAYVCDRCGRRASAEDAEASEFTCLDYVAGYNSILGDGSQITLDICQYCLKETLGQWLNISSKMS